MKTRRMKKRSMTMRKMSMTNKSQKSALEIFVDIFYFIILLGSLFLWLYGGSE